MLLPSAINVVRGVPTPLEFTVRWTGVKPEYEINATGADRRYPANEHAWKVTHQMQLTGHAVRHMSLWAYSRGVPVAQRTPVQQLAVDQYVCPDWFAEFLTGIARSAVINKRAREYWPTVRKDDIGYDPRFMAHYLQYREIEPRGVEFLDDCYTLSMPHVRGYTLYTALGAEPIPSRGTISDLDHDRRAGLEKLLFQVMGTPDYTKNVYRLYGWTSRRY
ncbi:hypothetical protein K438DRAFT_274728 [Mycena galopus ATCC 62051]|nr:hypothetical protein K438DRAFT_274728 [Mycena galopus ATCC 62051]